MRMHCMYLCRNNFPANSGAPCAPYLRKVGGPQASLINSLSPERIGTGCMSPHFSYLKQQYPLANILLVHAYPSCLHEEEAKSGPWS